MSSPVRRGRGIGGPPELFPPGPGGSRKNRSGTRPAIRSPATATWKKAPDVLTAAPYRRMFTSGFFTGTGSESAWSLPIQSAKRPSTRTVDGGAIMYARMGPPRMTTGTSAVALVMSTWITSPGRGPEAEAKAVIVISGWPWVKTTDPVERPTVTPGVAAKTNEETSQEAPAGRPRACTRIVNNGAVVLLTTDVKGWSSRRTEPFGVSGARLRLEMPAKSSASTAIRNRPESNPVRSYVETCASTPWTEAAAGGEPIDCRWLQLTSALLGNP